MVARDQYEARIRLALERSPITALLGPRQSGKTTLARAVAADRPSTTFDLESPRDQQRLVNAELMLGSLRGLVVIDEVQLRPDLFPILRVLADRHRDDVRFLILGSASPELRDGASESLAGRIEFIDLTGFRMDETGPASIGRLWVRGGFPRSYLAETEDDSFAWRDGFIRTFLQRDLPEFGIRTASSLMRRFWTMMAHYHGQTWNSSELARSLGKSDKTIRGYLDTLTDTYMIRQLHPWFENISKRQVKAPKVYLRDSGILHALLRLRTELELHGHPKVGASWEGFALEQVMGVLDAPEAYFWSVHSGAELDLLIFVGGRRVGFEFKFTERPSVTRSMRSALGTLTLAELWIVTPGDAVYRVDDRVVVCGLSEFPRTWRARESGSPL